MNDCSYVYNNTLPSKMQYETEKTKKRKRDRGKKSGLPCGCCNNKEGGFEWACSCIIWLAKRRCGTKM